MSIPALARLALTPHAIHLARIVVGHQVNDPKAASTQALTTRMLMPRSIGPRTVILSTSRLPCLGLGRGFIVLVLHRHSFSK